MYWKAGQKILCAGRMIALDPRLFGLYITNFACGPDSYLLKYFSKEMEGKPFLTIEIDEHSADAGIITRCEAFIDTIKGGGTHANGRPIPLVNISTGLASQKRLYIPYMLDQCFIIAAAARHFGVDAEALPMSDEQTLELGSRYTSGKECFPSIITTGDIVKKTMAPDFDPDKAAFLMAGASGPCRFGQYSKLHRMILDEIGLPQVPILNLDQTKDYYNHLAALGKGYRLRVWKGITVLDLIYKMLMQTRPYEVNKGETDAVYDEYLKSLITLLESKNGDFVSFSRKARDAFQSIKVDQSTLKPRIGVIGEIFVRNNQFSNGFVARRLEDMGAVCSLPPFEEWLDYIDYQRRRRSRQHVEGGWKDWAKQKLTEFVQERTAEPMRRQFDSCIECFTREADIHQILRYASTYVNPALEGETVLSMGRSVEYAHHDFDGILNIIPFGCMPGTSVSMLLHQFRHDHGIPVFNLVVDGTKDLAQDIRLEAFFQQCLEHMSSRQKSGGASHI
jgi:predicted nucleotide-binding protein (sugar kinase/HSP70/actin superfamily)